MCNDNSLYYDETLFIYTVANHGEKCEESVQCNYSNETVCREGTCKCKDAFIYNGKRCVGIIRKYGVYISNKTYNIVMEWHMVLPC
jgi:hypothetical protein